MKHKVCYILPEYRENTDTHLAHIGELLQEASKELDIFLIILRGTRPRRDFGCTDAKVIDASNLLTHHIMLRYWILRARLKGYKDFYVHYSFLSAYIASILVRISGGRVFYWNCGEPWKFSRSGMKEKFERKVYANISFLVTGAWVLAHEYAERYRIEPERIKILPNWVDISKFQNMHDKSEMKKTLGLPADKKIIFFAHRLSSRKGSKMILPVASEFLQQKKDVHFAIAGSGPDEETLRGRVEKNSLLRSGVTMLGAVPNRDMAKYLAAADIFFMPSQEEGFPRSLLEAMAAGVPCVASDVGAVAWLLPGTSQGFIVPSEDAMNFVKALKRLLSESEEEIAKIKKDLRDRAAEFDVRVVVKQFIGLFE